MHIIRHSPDTLFKSLDRSVRAQIKSEEDAFAPLVLSDYDERLAMCNAMHLKIQESARWLRMYRQNLTGKAGRLRADC